MLVSLCVIGLIASHEWTFASEKSKAKMPIESGATLVGQQEQKSEQKEDEAIRPDKPPKLIKKVDPVYPEEARKAGIEGEVIVEATTDKEGNVAKAVILEGKNESLNKAALDAIRQWKYEVFLIKGEPMPVVFTVTVRFALADKEEKITHSDMPPKLIKKVDPVYPEEARKAGIEGVVIVEATTDKEGNVVKVKVLKGEQDILNKAAMDAIKQWKYEPFIHEGKSIGVEFVVTVQFKLKDKNKDKKLV